MFSRAAKSVAKNFRQRGYHAAEDKFKKTGALVLATAKSRGPGILNPVVEQQVEKTALNIPKSSEQNGLFSTEMKKSSLQKKQSEARELMSVFRSISTKSRHGNAANRQLRTFPVGRSAHKFGISKQLKTPGARMCAQDPNVMCSPKEKRSFTPSGLVRGIGEITTSLRFKSVRNLHGVLMFIPTSDSGGRRNPNDDYFPLVEEFEDELGPSWSDQVQRIPASSSPTDKLPRSSSHIEQDRDCVTRKSPLQMCNLSRLDQIVLRYCQLAAQWSTEVEKTVTQSTSNLLSKNMNDDEAHEKLYTLQKKVEEFKRKLLRLRGDTQQNGKDAKSSPTNNGKSQSNDTTRPTRFVPVGQREVLWNAEGRNWGERPPERIKEVPCHPPDERSAPLTQSANPVKKKKGKKVVCVKYPPKKPVTFFREYRPGESGTWWKGGEARDLLSLLGSGCHYPQKRFYGKTEGPPKDPPSCPPVEKKPSSPSSDEKCPPCKIIFRECPPPPKLPELPKCPPPCVPPPAPPPPKCPAPPKCPSPPPPPPPSCPPPQPSPCKGPSSPPFPPPPKQKCSGHRISTHATIDRDCQYVEPDGRFDSREFRQRCAVFVVPRRGISSSSANFGSKCKSKSVQNCGVDKKSKIDSKSGDKKPKTGQKSKGFPDGGCQGGKGCRDKSKKSGSPCREKPRTCAKKPPKNCKKLTDNCPSCAPKPRCPPPPPPRTPCKQSCEEWKPPVCPPAKLLGPPPCPELSVPHPEPEATICPPPPPLPKPPCRPVCLCPCPPPPKLPPGSCPDIRHIEEQTDRTCPQPCPPKPLPPCPKNLWCPSKPICPPKK